VDRIQIREKDLGGGELHRLALQAMEAIRGKRSTLFINDRLDVAMAVEASGVHVGRSALPPDAARRIGGENLVIGASAHTLDEALEAQDAGADYLFLGPVFHTPSKAAYGPPIGISRLEAILRKVRLPVYAIGGISPQKLDLLRQLPIAGVAMVSAFARALSVEDLVREVHGPHWG
jgi:thiamine-phosphate pyrophosphorylase